MSTTLPEAHFIEAKVGTSIVALATGPLPGIEVPVGLLYTVAFHKDQGFPALIEAVSAAFDEAGLEQVDFCISGRNLLTVEPEFVPGERMYDGLKILQGLFRPQIPRVALVYETRGADGWNIQMSILGGFLSSEDIATTSAGIKVAGGQVTEVLKSAKQQADVFCITVPVRNNRGRRGFLQALRGSCGVHASLQDTD